MKEKWDVWYKDKNYGKILYKRAKRELPEMESSKAIAQMIAKWAASGDVIVDVGCGCGHYLVSLSRQLSCPFSYYGFDACPYYVSLARKAFPREGSLGPCCGKAIFAKGDVYHLPLSGRFADIVMCNNLLLHLPSIERPMKELWRVTKRLLIIRTLIGKHSFRIKQINDPEEYDKNGEPEYYHFLNIYSESYIKSVLRTLQGVKKISLFFDSNFKPENIGDVNYKHKKKPFDLTVTVNKMQVTNYIIMPWHFLIVEKK